VLDGEQFRPFVTVAAAQRYVTAHPGAELQTYAAAVAAS
jgi:hypothetical protein